MTADVTLWIAAGFLALLFAGTGVAKLTRSREELATQGMEFVEDLHDGQVRALGVVEVLAAAGLVLPPLVGVLPQLVGVTAVALVLLMLGAMAFHVRRDELPRSSVNIAVIAIAGFVAYGRLGPHAF